MSFFHLSRLILLFCVVLAFATTLCHAQKIEGYFIGQMPGLGAVQLAIPPGADTALSGTFPMLVEGSERSFTVRPSDDGLVLLIGSVARAECRNSTDRDSLLGLLRMQDGSARGFGLKKVAGYEYVHHAIPVSVWYASERTEFPDLLLTVNGAEVTGTARRFYDEMPLRGFYGRDGVLKIAVDSMGLLFTGSFEGGGRALVGTMRRKGKEPLEVRYPRVWRPEDSTVTIDASVPFIVRIFTLRDLPKKMAEAVSVEIDRLGDARYRRLCANPPLMSDFIPRSRVASDAEIAFYDPDLISFELTTHGDIGGTDVELFSIGLVRGVARRLTLADLFGTKPGIERRLNAEILTQLQDKPGSPTTVAAPIDTASSLLTKGSWCLVPSGLRFLLPSRSPEAAPIFLTIPYDRLRDIIDPSGPLRVFLRGTH